MTLENSDIGVLGHAKKVIVTKDDTIIIGGRGSKADLEERVGSLEE